MRESEFGSRIEDCAAFGDDLVSLDIMPLISKGDELAREFKALIENHPYKQQLLADFNEMLSFSSGLNDPNFLQYLQGIIQMLKFAPIPNVPAPDVMNVTPAVMPSFVPETPNPPSVQEVQQTTLYNLAPPLPAISSAPQKELSPEEKWIAAGRPYDANGLKMLFAPIEGDGDISTIRSLLGKVVSMRKQVETYPVTFPEGDLFGDYNTVEVSPYWQIFDYLFEFTIKGGGSDYSSRLYDKGAPDIKAWEEGYIGTPNMKWTKKDFLAELDEYIVQLKYHSEPTVVMVNSFNSSTGQVELVPQSYGPYRFGNTYQLALLEQLNEYFNKVLVRIAGPTRTVLKESVTTAADEPRPLVQEPVPVILTPVVEQKYWDLSHPISKILRRDI